LETRRVFPEIRDYPLNLCHRVRLLTDPRSNLPSLAPESGNCLTYPPADVAEVGGFKLSEGNREYRRAGFRQLPDRGAVGREENSLNDIYRAFRPVFLFCCGFWKQPPSGSKPLGGFMGNHEISSMLQHGEKVQLPHLSLSPL